MNESIVFVVRIWTGTHFRAVVRQVDEEPTHVFETPTALARFLGVRSRGGGRTEPDLPPRQTDDWRTR